MALAADGVIVLRFSGWGMMLSAGFGTFREGGRWGL